MGRNRKIKISFWVNEKERDEIDRNAADSGRNRSSFLRYVGTMGVQYAPISQKFPKLKRKPQTASKKGTNKFRTFAPVVRELKDVLKSKDKHLKKIPEAELMRLKKRREERIQSARQKLRVEN